MTPYDQAAQCAQRWYGTHQAQYLARDTDRMVDACAQHLRDTLTLSDTSALWAARQVLAEQDASTAPGYIDIDRSTAHLLVLRDTRAGATYMITLPELFALVDVRPARAA